jgi:hypothetical protein
MLVRFFSCRVYIDLSYRDTLGYEWPLVCCCHLVVCLVVLDGWLEDEYGYGYVIMIIIVFTLITLMMLAFCMF